MAFDGSVPLSLDRILYIDLLIFHNSFLDPEDVAYLNIFGNFCAPEMCTCMQRITIDFLKK